MGSLCQKPQANQINAFASKGVNKEKEQQVALRKKVIKQ